MNDKVKFHATESLVCIHWLEDLDEAAELMDEKRIRHVVAVDDYGTIVGILSDRDLLHATATRVLEAMSSPVETLDEEASIADAARLFIEQQVSSLLVVRGRYAVGIITTEDLLRLTAKQDAGFVTSVKEALNSIVLDSRVGGIANALANVGI